MVMVTVTVRLGLPGVSRTNGSRTSSTRAGHEPTDAGPAATETPGQAAVGFPGSCKPPDQADLLVIQACGTVKAAAGGTWLVHAATAPPIASTATFVIRYLPGAEPAGCSMHST